MIFSPSRNSNCCSSPTWSPAWNGRVPPASKFARRSPAASPMTSAMVRLRLPVAAAGPPASRSPCTPSLVMDKVQTDRVAASYVDGQSPRASITATASLVALRDTGRRQRSWSGSTERLHADPAAFRRIAFRRIVVERARNWHVQRSGRTVQSDDGPPDHRTSLRERRGSCHAAPLSFQPPRTASSAVARRHRHERRPRLLGGDVRRTDSLRFHRAAGRFLGTRTRASIRRAHRTSPVAVNTDGSGFAVSRRTEGQIQHICTDRPALADRRRPAADDDSETPTRPATPGGRKERPDEPTAPSRKSPAPRPVRAACERRLPQLARQPPPSAASSKSACSLNQIAAPHRRLALARMKHDAGLEVCFNTADDARWPWSVTTTTSSLLRHPESNAAPLCHRRGRSGLRVRLIIPESPLRPSAGPLNRMETWLRSAAPAGDSSDGSPVVRPREDDVLVARPPRGKTSVCMTRAAHGALCRGGHDPTVPPRSRPCHVASRRRSGSLAATGTIRAGDVPVAVRCQCVEVRGVGIAFGGSELRSSSPRHLVRRQEVPSCSVRVGHRP